MIKSIMMKDCATYSAEGIVIADCQKINFLYGPNGSGKSTIGNYLSNMDDLAYSSCGIEWTDNIPVDIKVN